MAFTAASRRKGTRTKQANKAGKATGFIQTVSEGERAFAAGEPAAANPYAEGTDEHGDWLFGWEGMLDVDVEMHAQANAQAAKEDALNLWLAQVQTASAMATLVNETLEAIEAEATAVAPTDTREAWLLAAAELIRPLLADRANLTLPSYRVTCGWPSKGGRGAAKRVLGECWAAEASADSHAEIFISPMEDDRRTVLAILAHELIHACLPAGTGHKRPFCLAAGKLGFVAPFTKLMPTDDLHAWADEIIAALPEYPHARLNGAKAEGAPKKQTTRMIKAVCEEDHGGEPCGYQVRLTRKWIEEVGAPICPRHNLPMVCEGLDMGDEDGDQDDGEG